MKAAKQRASERVAHYRASANYEYELAHGHGCCPPFDALYIEALKDTDRMKLSDLLDELEGWNQ